MNQLETRPDPSISTLADYFKASRIDQYAHWANGIRLSKIPRKYQVEDLNHLAAFLPRCNLFNEAGLGKTLPVQALALWLVGLGNKGICVMPPTLVRQFYDSFHLNFVGVQRNCKIEMLQGSIPERQKLVDRWAKEGWPDILLMSFRMFVGTGRSSKSTHHRLHVRDVEAKFLRIKGYSFVVVDEANAVKNTSSQIHKAVAEFAGTEDVETGNGVVLMTGTPIQTNVEDAFGLIKLTDPKRYSSKRAFDRMHCTFNPNAPYRNVVGYHELDALYNALYARGRRILKKDVLSELPPKVISEVRVELEKKHKEVYDKLIEERLVEIGDTIINATTASALYQYSQRALICPEKFSDEDVGDNIIIDTLDDLIGTIGEKTLVYVWYQDSVEKLKERYKKLHPAILNGSLSAREKDIQKTKFITDPRCKLLIANHRSGGIGVDGLQDVCSHVIFAELLTSPGDFDQAVSRLHRSGQARSSVNVYLIVPMRTIAVKLRNDLLRKQENAVRALKDKKVILSEIMGEEGIQGQFD